MEAFCANVDLILRFRLSLASDVFELMTVGDACEAPSTSLSQAIPQYDFTSFAFVLIIKL